MRQSIEAVVYHLQRIAQIIFTARPSGQIGKVSRDSGTVRGSVVLIKADALDREGEFLVHRVRHPILRARSE
ncbi:hypothetical protein D3C80_2090710 [compost metagenome]